MIRNEFLNVERRVERKFSTNSSQHSFENTVADFILVIPRPADKTGQKHKLTKERPTIRSRSCENKDKRGTDDKSVFEVIFWIYMLKQFSLLFTIEFTLQQKMFICESYFRNDQKVDGVWNYSLEYYLEEFKEKYLDEVIILQY
ncbi:hypothetical protein ABEB36_011441 [Hypothenemus hampei]|uniref:Uncharacterized protein n=1 Tax=Hypothenemus hampei TaxID=57062 RepID=A0ABD1EFY9_HYPHA